MTPQESTMLNDLVRKVQQTQLPEKDAEAGEVLQQSLGGNPDSIYILAQTVLVQNIALDQAKGQVQQLRQQLQDAQSQFQAPQPVHSTSFLGSLLGRHDAPPLPPQNFPPRPGAAPQYYPPTPGYAPDYAAAPPVAPSGGSSFLRSAATTAAGVAAGALAFEGVESILHGFGHGGGGGFGGDSFGGGGFGGGGLGEQRPEETVINNYYGDDPNQGVGGGEREASFGDGSGDRFGGDQGAQLDDTSSTGDYSFSDSDDSSFDDSGSFDDGGGDDSSAV
jgi:hypothetical protein